MRSRTPFPDWIAALLLACPGAPGGESRDHPFEMFLPDPGVTARLQPLLDRLESDSYAEREEADRELRALPALPGCVREQARAETRPESRARLRALVEAFPLETENDRLTRVLQQIAKQGAKGHFDAITRVMARGLWTPEESSLLDAARATVTSADWPLVERGLKDESPATRNLAVAALGGIPGAGATGRLVEMLDDADDRLVMLAAAGLAARGDKRCLGAYARLLDAGDFAIRHQAHAALRGLTGMDFAYDPLAEKQDRQTAVKRWRDWTAGKTAAITGTLPRDPVLVLFNGTNLDGWEVFAQGRKLESSPSWEAKDGTLHCNGKEPGDLWTASRFEDYVLTLEYKLDAAACDSGVGVLLTKDAEQGPAGPGYLEVQLLPGKAGDFYQIGAFEAEARGAPIQFTSPRVAEVDDPPGRWHKLRLTVRDGTVEAEVDGKTINHAAKGPREAGRIVLRNETTPVSFRAILLRPLESARPGTSDPKR